MLSSGAGGIGLFFLLVTARSAYIGLGFCYKKSIYCDMKHMKDNWSKCHMAGRAGNDHNYNIFQQ